MPDKRKPDEDRGQRSIDHGRHFAEIARAPLKRQDSSDAWNERDNKLVASRTAVMMLIRGTLEKNRAKAAKKRKLRRGSKSSQ